MFKIIIIVLVSLLWCYLTIKDFGLCRSKYRQYKKAKLSIDGRRALTEAATYTLRVCLVLITLVLIVF